MRCWRVDAVGQSLVLASAGGVPEVCYWGPSLAPGEDLAALAALARRDVTGGMLDENPPLSICPEPALSFPGQPGMAAGRVLGPLRLTAVREHAGLAFDCAADGVTVTFTFRPEGALIVAETALHASEPVRVDWLAAPVMPGPEQGAEIVDFTGRWCGEMKEARTPWTPGARLRESRVGRTDHAHFPGAFFPDAGAGHTQGVVRAAHYGWSGGHRMIAEELPDGRRQIQFGHARRTWLDKRRAFRTAPLYLAASDAGRNGCAVAFQRHARRYAAAHRPVHYNSWEAVYFDHDVATLKDIATRAAALGAERFVLDDGWFGLRDDDTTSLGDWVVDGRKYPEGLGPLISHVRSLGMTFGLWLEPEMISPKSALFRDHPDWALGPADQVQGRAQMVLDVAREDVRNYLFLAIAELLSSHDISYIKWDHNRVLPTPDAAQTEGLYALLARLSEAFPEVEIESCASGGGRIDFGILEHCGRVWLSDSNDALERQRIQAGAAGFLPAALTGSHVGPRICHTSGRVLGMSFRAWTAAARHMGFEMDPRELTDDESATLASVTAWWKANRAWLMEADILRLDHQDPALMAEEHLAADGARFVVFAAKLDTSAQIGPRPLMLSRLDPAAYYRVSLRNRDEAPGLSRSTPALKEGPLTLSGSALMRMGLTLPWSFPQSVWVIEGKRMEEERP